MGLLSLIKEAFGGHRTKEDNVEGPKEKNPKTTREWAERIISLAPQYLEQIGNVTYKIGDFNSAKVTGATSLLEVLAIHKNAWNDGFQDPKIGPNPHGMYRCKTIESMTASDVFIGGNLFGLNTNNIEYWERYKDEGKTDGGCEIYSYLTVYQIVLQRYKYQLASNIQEIAEKAQEELDSL